MSEVQPENQSMSMSDLAEFVLALDRLREQRYAAELAAYIDALLEDAVYRDLVTRRASDEQEIDLLADAQLGILDAKHMAVLERIAPTVVADARIEIEETEIHTDLAQAGIDLGDVSPAVYQEIASAKALENRMDTAADLPSFADRLKAAGDALKSAAEKVDPGTAVSVVMLGVTVGSGGTLGAAIAGARLAGKLYQTERMQAIAASLGDAMQDGLLKLGIPQARIEESRGRMKTAYERMNSSTAMKAGILATGVLGGIVAGAGMENIKDLATTGAELAKETFGNLADSAEKAIDAAMNADFPAVDGSAELAGADAIEVPDPTEPMAPGMEEPLAPAPAGEVAMEALAMADVPYTVAPGDTLWGIAADHYEAATGEPASPQQIAGMIAELGVDDPHAIHPGQIITFPAEPTLYESISQVTWDDAGLNGGPGSEMVASEPVWAPEDTMEIESLAWSEDWGPEPPPVDLVAYEELTGKPWQEPESVAPVMETSSPRMVADAPAPESPTADLDESAIGDYASRVNDAFDTVAATTDPAPDTSSAPGM